MTPEIKPLVFETVPFAPTGDTLWARRDDDGQVLVSVRPICTSIGLDWSSQRHRLLRNPVLSATMVMMTMVAGDGRNRAVVCLPLDLISGWLFGVDVNRVKPELRDRLIAYQRECHRVLFNHFMGGNRSGGRKEGHHTFSFEMATAFMHDHQIRVLEYLRKTANPETGQNTISYARIAHSCGISLENVKRTLCLFLALGLIEARQGQGLWLLDQALPARRP